MDISIPYTPTPIQKEVHFDDHRFKVAVWGRRSGKSTFAINHAIRFALENPNTKIWVITPTFSQGKDIYWRGHDMLNKYLPKELVKKKNDSELLIELITGSIIQFKGADRPETMRGSGLDLIISDEVSEHRYAKETWETILMPSLSDKQGSAIFIGTPKGENFFKELYDLGTGVNQFWKSWRVPTWESGAPWTLTPAGREEIQRAKDTMTEDYFQQEYGADFRRFTGLVFKSFDPSIHVVDFEVMERYSMENGMDFGWTNPTTCAFTYFNSDDVWYVFDEHYASELPAREHVARLRAKKNQYKNSLEYTMGDSASPEMIREFNDLGWHISPAVKGKDSIIAGINKINERMIPDPLTGQPKMFIHPRCVNLINELNRYRWKEQKDSQLNERDVPEDAYDHLIDALRYVINRHTAGGMGKYIPKTPIKYLYRPNRSI